MHEMGIVFQIIRRLERAASENSVSRIGSVTLELGEVSGIVDYYLLDCWKWASSKSSLLEGCEMKIEVLPAVTQCNACGSEYPTVEYGRRCPHCESEDTVLVKGDEINIKEMTGA